MSPEIDRLLELDAKAFLELREAREFKVITYTLCPKLARATKIALAELEDVESRLIGYGHSEEERQNNPLMKALAEIRKEIAS